VVARPITQNHTCLMCDRTTTRLYGVGAALELADGSGVRARGEALGYCLDHRDCVIDHWRASLEANGDIKWITLPDEIVDLRPADVHEFLAQADSVFQQTLPQGEAIGDRNRCPHCGGTVAWGTGPHVVDAQQRQGTQAWECTSCGAAGLGYGAPPTA
jgi:hypothetical protein